MKAQARFGKNVLIVIAALLLAPSDAAGAAQDELAHVRTVL